MNIATTLLDMLTAVSAIIAAYVWFKSARVKAPNSFSIHVVRSNHFSPLGDNPLGGTYVGHGYSDDLTNLGQSLSKQSKLSSKAATFAGLATFLQAIAVILRLL